MIKIVKVLIVIVLVAASAIYLTVRLVTSQPEFGTVMNAESLSRALESPQYRGDHFENTPAKIPSSIMVNIKDMMGGQIRRPAAQFPIESPEIGTQADSGLKAIWFGHATAYVEMDGKRIMTDPMLSNQAFPVGLVAPVRYNPPPMAVDQLPVIDFVTISHDHYDHLDMKTIQALAANGTTFFVGLGIKAHLVHWGVKESQIHEMDWWQSVKVGDFTIHCTPARHYSGRKAMDNSTLWTSWVIEGPDHRVYHSGDSGYASHFKEIAARLGPINIAFIKIGDYGLDPGWRDIHMHTEKSVQAHMDLEADIMFPIHWGTFDLSNHDWFEPINLATQHAAENGVNLVTPKLGQAFVYGQSMQNQEWWKPLEAESIKEATD